MDRFFTASIDAMEVAVAAIGDRLGYYAALDGRTLTPSELAAATGVSTRYTREWLEHQAVSGYVDLLPGPAPAEHRYRLAPGVAEVLARPGQLTYLAPLARQVTAAGAQWGRLVEGARTGHGLAWPEFGPDMREGQADMNAPQFREMLAASWLPVAVPELHRRMAAGAEVRVADVGCGGGWAAVALADAFPGVEVDGYDLDPPTVSMARANVERHGLKGRVRIVQGDVAQVAPTADYDFAMAFECIHDLPRPVDVLAGMHRMLRPGGVALVADMAGADELRTDRDPVQRALYGFSLLVCLPDAMSGGAVDATGTVMRPATMRRYAEEAGFASVQVLPLETDFWRFYLLSR
jgi:2-polyprenyl-3-methyl-5-hydroxy-6-metoxy-1,4-benzoquinol methylase